MGLLAGILLGAGAALFPGVADAATPTITESFSPASIALNGTSTLTFAIDNPGGSLPSVGFDDTLPPGVQVAGTPTTTCLSPPALATSGGPSDLAFIDVALADSSCTVSATVRGVQAGAWDNPVTVNVDGTGTPVTASIGVVAPPSISAAFGTALLGLDGTTPLTFTITNPNAAFPLSGVTFTDTFPAGLVVAGQPTDGCGGSVAGDPGSNSIGLSGGRISPASSCTVSAVVAATATGAVADATTQVFSAEGGIGNTASAGLTVIGAPTIVLSSPASGHVYAFGTRVPASYGCADDPDGPGISSCKGEIPNGAPIDTSKAGEYAFTVTALSRDGGVSSDTVFYAVAPDNRFSVARIKPLAGGVLRFEVRVPGAGRVSVLETTRTGAGFVVARASVSAPRATTIHLSVKPDRRGRATLTARRRLPTTLVVTYTPKGGTGRTERFRVTLS